jgi:hypothetical protein
MKLVRELVDGVGYTLVASMERKNPSYHLKSTPRIAMVFLLFFLSAGLDELMGLSASMWEARVS